MKRKSFLKIIYLIALMFISSCEPDLIMPGYVIDIEGNAYHTIKIGEQVWMAENLRTGHFPNGDPIPKIETNEDWVNLYYTPGSAYSWYLFDSVSYAGTYGALYTWMAAMNGAGPNPSIPSGVQGVCPSGWHLPSDGEWKKLANFLGGEDVTGGKLKEEGTSHWLDPNYGATNESGFTALPGGFGISTIPYGGLGEIGVWWSTDTTDNIPNVWLIEHDYGKIYTEPVVLNIAVSVRCIKD
jgi:uncharacterized protein (TIGR02145 family)